jgi:hypothetical protein
MLAAGAFALLAPLEVHAQDGAAAPATTPASAAEAAGGAADEEQIAAWYSELQGLHQQLQSIQDRALEDPQLSADQETLGTEIRAAVARADSTMETRMARMTTLETEAHAASAAGDSDRLQTLMLEATDIQERFMELQQQVLGEPAMAAKIGVFQTALQAKMIQIEPGAQGLMDRFSELEGKLTAAFGEPN